MWRRLLASDNPWGPILQAKKRTPDVWMSSKFQLCSNKSFCKRTCDQVTAFVWIYSLSFWLQTLFDLYTTSQPGPFLFFLYIPCSSKLSAVGVRCDCHVERVYIYLIQIICLCILFIYSVFQVPWGLRDLHSSPWWSWSVLLLHLPHDEWADLGLVWNHS